MGSTATLHVIAPPSSELKTVYGYVISVKGSKPLTGPAFGVQLYIPTATPNEPALGLYHWFAAPEVRDNRELVWVSLLRDALVHSIPVALVYDSKDETIFSLELRSTVFHITGEKAKITGNVKMIAVNEFGLWKEDIYNPDSASIVISNPDIQLRLTMLLQSPNSETKRTQLDMLQRAYQDNKEVTITYQKTPVLGKPDAPPENVIVGVQIGAEQAVIPPKGKPAGKVA